MNRLFVTLLGLAFCGCASHEAAKPSGPVDLAIQEQWVGDFPITALNQFPADQRKNQNGSIGEAKTFAAIWTSFQPGTPLPSVDFSKDLVLFTRNVQFFNRTRIGRVKLTDGVAELLAMETMSARPIEDKVAMALAVVPRGGIRFVESGGQRIPVSAP